MAAEGYEIMEGYPPVEDYCRLRAENGLTPKTPAQAENISTGSWYGAYMIHKESEQIVGMGRCISDGCWYYHIVDMAVDKEHQRKGLGDAILKQILAHIHKTTPGRPYINLLADEPGRRLYAKHGFTESAPGSIGMHIY